MNSQMGMGAIKGMCTESQMQTIPRITDFNMKFAVMCEFNCENFYAGFDDVQLNH